VREGYFAMATGIPTFTEQCAHSTAMACRLVTSKHLGLVIQVFAHAISDPKRREERHLNDNN